MWNRWTYDSWSRGDAVRTMLRAREVKQLGIYVCFLLTILLCETSFMTFYDGKPLEYHLLPTTRNKPERTLKRKRWHNEQRQKWQQQQQSTWLNIVHQESRGNGYNFLSFHVFTPLSYLFFFFFIYRLFFSFCISLCAVDARRQRRRRTKSCHTQKVYCSNTT